MTLHYSTAKSSSTASTSRSPAVVGDGRNCSRHANAGASQRLAGPGLNPLNLEVYNGQLLFEGISKPGLSWLVDDGRHRRRDAGNNPQFGTYLFGFDPTDLTALTPGLTPPPAVTSSILWQNTSTGQASIWDMNGSTLVGGGAVSPNPGPSWTEIGTGDFNDDGHSDILWQNASTGQASIWEMNGNTLIGGGPVSPNPGPCLACRSEPATSMTTAFPTSCGRTRTPAKPRSGK